MVPQRWIPPLSSPNEIQTYLAGSKNLAPPRWIPLPGQDGLALPKHAQGRPRKSAPRPISPKGENLLQKQLRSCQRQIRHAFPLVPSNAKSTVMSSPNEPRSCLASADARKQRLQGICLRKTALTSLQFSCLFSQQTYLAVSKNVALATLDPPARAGRTSAPKQAQGSPEKVPNVPSETGENLLKTASFLPKADFHAFPWFPNAGSRL